MLRGACCIIMPPIMYVCNRRMLCAVLLDTSTPLDPPPKMYVRSHLLLLPCNGCVCMYMNTVMLDALALDVLTLDA